jgi:hypothetical protein
LQRRRYGLTGFLGKLLEEGDIMTRKRYAEYVLAPLQYRLKANRNMQSTLEKIAEHGPDVFYTGEMGKAVSGPPFCSLVLTRTPSRVHYCSNSEI